MAKFTATISEVKDKTREWGGGQHGPLAFVDGSFSDGTDWSVTCKPENAAARLREMQDLVGKTGEFEAEPGKEYMGRKSWKLKNYPGKPQPGGYGGGGGRGGGFGQNYKYSEEGARAERDSIHRSVALQESVAMSVGLAAAGKDPGNIEILLSVADSFYHWLAKGAPPATPQQIAQSIPGVTTGDQIKVGSVLEQTIKTIGQYTNLKDIAACSDFIKAKRDDGTLEGAERNRLDILTAKRAIAICTTEEMFKSCEQFIRGLNKQGRLNDSDFGRLCIEHADKLSIFQTTSQAEDTF